MKEIVRQKESEPVSFRMLENANRMINEAHYVYLYTYIYILERPSVTPDSVHLLYIYIYMCKDKLLVHNTNARTLLLLLRVGSMCKYV